MAGITCADFVELCAPSSLSRLSQLSSDVVDCVLLNYLITFENGEYRLFGELHSPQYIEDGVVTIPYAVVKKNLSKEWYRYGKLHRGGGQPAVVEICGGLQWYWDGKPHRIGDLPAIIRSDGSCGYYLHGVLHRGGGQPAVIYATGSKSWYEHGVLQPDRY